METQIQTYIDFLYKKYPKLRNKSVQINTSGLSNIVIIFDGTLVFRFPRTNLDERQMHVEKHFLPRILPHLSVLIPNFIYSSNPSYPYSYVGYPLIPGNPLEKSELYSFTLEERKNIANDLGQFLNVLHTFPVTPSDFPYKNNSNAMDDLKKEIERVIYPIIDEKAKSWIEDLFHYYQVSDPFESSLVHGDLRPHHILINPETRCINGIIDFGWIRLDDPAYDLALIYLSYGEPFFNEVLQYYKTNFNKSFLERIKNIYIKALPFQPFIHNVENKNKEAVKMYLQWLNSMISS